MAWVRTDAPPETAAIIASHTLNPAAVEAHMGLYRALMFSESPLSRSEREAIATIVSWANDCHYWRVHHGPALARESGDVALAEAVASGRIAELDDERLRALLSYAVGLTRAPSAVEERDLEPLRAAGLDDRAIVDANQVTAYFNYVNRIAEGLGVELEPGTPWPPSLEVPAEGGA